MIFQQYSLECQTICQPKNEQIGLPITHRLCAFSSLTRCDINPPLSSHSLSLSWFAIGMEVKVCNAAIQVAWKRWKPKLKTTTHTFIHSFIACPQYSYILNKKVVMLKV